MKKLIEFVRRPVVMVVFFAVVLVVAAVLLVFGIVTHEEAGLDPRMPRWERGDFPLAICVGEYGHDNFADEHDQEIVQVAADVINERLGFTAYRTVAREPCIVQVLLGAPHDETWEHPGGRARNTNPGCSIEISNTGTAELLHLTLQHELGHCLGLAHDDYDLSIMRLVQRPTPDREFPPRITDSDRALLRELYAP